VSETTDYDVLVEQLQTPRNRRVARRKLVAAGAVGPLLECLASPNEPVVWSAVESLGELREPRAVAPLVDLLARGQLVLDVCEALTRITGKDFGADAARWRRWLDENKGQKPTGLDVADCIARTAEYLGTEPTGAGDSFRFKLDLEDGRAQKVAVYFGRKDDQDQELVVIYSECGPVEPKHYEAALRKNLTIPSGALAIRDVSGQPCLVMVDTMLAALVTPAMLARRIEHIARRADSVEKVLSKEDVR
jgi:hypothetical protein